MKKYKIKYWGILFIGIFIIISSCSKSSFKDNFYDPERTTQTSMEGLYGGLLYNAELDDNNTILPRYWNLFTFQIPMIGTYTQTIGFENNKGEYEQALNYTQSRWNYYYNGPLASFRELEKKYKSLNSNDDKEGYKLFMATAKIFFYDQTTQMIDMWGDIPFSEAGKVNTTGGDIILPKYDNAEKIYDTVLTNLKKIADFLATVNPDPFYSGQLSSYDIINNGDIMKWRKYCNSLRLRLAMRISYQNESKAQTIVQEILNAPSEYPIVSDNSENIEIAPEGPNLNAIANKHESGIKGGINNTLAPGFMLNDIMKPSNDPRIQVYFSKNKNGDYEGTPTNWTASRQSDSSSAEFLSRIDSTTFVENDQFPGIIVTAAEVSFFKAEALERWGGGSAEDAYKKGIEQSIDFWYSINNNNQNTDNFSGYDPKTPPTQTEINTFLSNSLIAYTGNSDDKLEKIATQLWIDYGLIRNYQSWNLIRRTGYPDLDFKTDPGSTQSPTPPTRLLYPTSERTLNEDHYNAVKNQDKVDGKIFWDVN